MATHTSGTAAHVFQLLESSAVAEYTKLQFLSSASPHQLLLQLLVDEMFTSTLNMQCPIVCCHCPGYTAAFLQAAEDYCCFQQPHQR